MAEKQLGNDCVIGFALMNTKEIIQILIFFPKDYLSKNYIAALNSL